MSRSNPGKCTFFALLFLAAAQAHEAILTRHGIPADRSEDLQTPSRKAGPADSRQSRTP